MKLHEDKGTIVLSDSFKSTISSKEIGKLWQKRCGFDFLPVSDGGEGAIEAIESVSDGHYRSINGIDVFITSETAYVETAKVVGYGKFKDVYTSNTYELGKIIQELYNSGIKKLVVFIGGTSTNDGGFGLLSALGYKFLNKSNETINPVPNNLNQIIRVEKCTLPEIEVVGCSDVTNTLCGQQGATFIYGTQKGIVHHQEIDQEINRIAKLINEQSIELPGSGAGGGIGYAITLFKSFRLIDGYSYIAQTANYKTLISNYSAVITGEGKLDEQTSNGKLPKRILEEAIEAKATVNGVFAIVDDCDMKSQFNAVYNIAKDNVVSEYNLKNTYSNYNEFITRYKMENKIYKGVLFDLDGVLCDTAKLHYLAWKKLANELGGDIDEQFNETLKGVDRAESLTRILNHINVKLDPNEFEMAMQRKNECYVTSLESLSEADVLPGIIEFITELKQANFKLAVASASKNAPIILEKIGLIEHIDSIASPDDIENNKPAPDIFLLAASQLGLTIHECIGIEDAQSGIQALNSANIDSIGIGKNLKDATIHLEVTDDLTLQLLK